MVSPKIFRSRWSALFWAAGILWTAYDVAEANRDKAPDNASAPADQDALGMTVSNADLATLANAMGN